MPPASSRDLRGARLQALRQIEGLTQTDLATKLGVTQAFVSHVENGLKALPRDVATTAADLYGLPVEFFAAPPSLTDEGFATFRKSSKATVHDENRVVATFGEAARLFQRASEASGYHTVCLDDARETDVEITAQNVRASLGLSGDEPVLNATRSLERLGVGVIHDLTTLPEDRRDHAGVSRPNSFVDRPLVATLGPLPSAVARMTVLHELAHIIYDRDRAWAIRGTRALEEKRAFRFAGAMLLPAAVVKKRITESLTLHGYLPVKADYGISVAAVIVRAAELGVISPERKRTLMIQMSSNGWRRNEPVAVADEQPILLNQATTRAIGTDARSVAQAVGVRYSDAARWTGLPLDPPIDSQPAEVIYLHGRRHSA
jgi:Zn-dependent peptidase ImmA (M78 family)/DNA-binding XRE family transcriptional regulator